MKPYQRSVEHAKIVWIKHYNKQSSKCYLNVEGQGNVKERLLGLQAGGPKAQDWEGLGQSSGTWKPRYVSVCVAGRKVGVGTVRGPGRQRVERIGFLSARSKSWAQCWQVTKP